MYVRDYILEILLTQAYQDMFLMLAYWTPFIQSLILRHPSITRCMPPSSSYPAHHLHTLWLIPPASQLSGPPRNNPHGSLPVLPAPIHNQTPRFRLLRRITRIHYPPSRRRRLLLGRQIRCPPLCRYRKDVFRQELDRCRIYRSSKSSGNANRYREREIAAMY